MKRLMRLIIKLFYKDNICLFLGSTDILPPPLSSEEETKYLILASNGDMEARNKLIEHNVRLVVFLAKKYENTGYDLEDLVSIGSIGLIKGINTYKMDKNTLLEKKLTARNDVKDRYYNRWQDVRGQINTEKALKEQIREFNANLKLEKQKLSLSSGSSGGGSYRSYSSRSSSGSRKGGSVKISKSKRKSSVKATKKTTKKSIRYSKTNKRTF